MPLTLVLSGDVNAVYDLSGRAESFRHFLSRCVWAIQDPEGRDKLQKQLRRLPDPRGLRDAIREGDLRVVFSTELVPHGSVTELDRLLREPGWGTLATSIDLFKAHLRPLFESSRWVMVVDKYALSARGGDTARNALRELIIRSVRSGTNLLLMTSLPVMWDEGSTTLDSYQAIIQTGLREAEGESVRVVAVTESSGRLHDRYLVFSGSDRDPWPISESRRGCVVVGLGKGITQFVDPSPRTITRLDPDVMNLVLSPFEKPHKCIRISRDAIEDDQGRKYDSLQEAFPCPTSSSGQS